MIYQTQSLNIKSCQSGQKRIFIARLEEPLQKPDTDLLVPHFIIDLPCITNILSDAKKLLYNHTFLEVTCFIDLIFKYQNIIKQKKEFKPISVEMADFFKMPVKNIYLFLFMRLHVPVYFNIHVCKCMCV